MRCGGLRKLASIKVFVYGRRNGISRGVWCVARRTCEGGGYDFDATFPNRRNSHRQKGGWLGSDASGSRRRRDGASEGGGGRFGEGRPGRRDGGRGCQGTGAARTCPIDY